jgi:hypothetical protein
MYSYMREGLNYTRFIAELNGVERAYLVMGDSIRNKRRLWYVGSHTPYTCTML